MKKNVLFFLYMSLFVVLPQCVTTTKNQKKQPIKTFKYVRGFRRHAIVKAKEYTAKVDGIECPFCAKSLVALVKKIEGVVEASYSQGLDGYEDGVLLVAWNIEKGDIPQSKIEEALQEEDFTLVSLGC